MPRSLTEGAPAAGWVYYGKSAEIASTRGDEQETNVACLRILQAALVYVNTCSYKTSSPNRNGRTYSPTTTGAG